MYSNVHEAGFGPVHEVKVKDIKSGLLRAAACGILLVGILSLAPDAAANLIVSPTRLVLESGVTNGQVFVINKSNEPITVRMSLVNRRMLPDGTFADAEEPEAGELFADDLLQYAPRRVQLGAGQGQTVRILARQPDHLPAGEYRSHLLFRVEPPVAQLSDTVTDGSADSKSLDIRLIPVYGVTIPVIVRYGKLSATASISDASILPAPTPNSPPQAAFQLNRSGNRSIFGNIRILHENTGVESLIGELRGLAVYVPLPSRLVEVPLNGLQARGLPQSGQIKIEFVSPEGRLLAEEIVQITH